MRLTLRDAGIPAYKKICRGRKWIGRVGPRLLPSGEPVADHAAAYFGKIGDIYVTAPDERAAFALVCARYFGCNSPAELAERNRRVRAANRMRRAEARDMGERLRRGDFSVIDQLFRRQADAERAEEGAWQD